MNKALLSCDIRQIEQEILQRKNDIAINILEIGDRLIIAKEILKHGEWSVWLEHNVMFTDRTARNYMKAARAFPEEKRKSISDLNGTKILLLSELPDNTRDEFIDEMDGETLRKMSTKELKDAIRTEKAGADIMAHFATTDEEDMEIEIEVEKLKPCPAHKEYIEDVIGIRKGADYIKWLGHISTIAGTKKMFPITITKDNIIIDGHETVRALRDLGITTVKARYAVCHESDLKETFDKTLELVFLSYQMCGYTRTSLYYHFGALYNLKKGDREEADRMARIFAENGMEINDKYKQWIDRLSDKLKNIEDYAESVKSPSDEEKRKPLPKNVKALCNDLYNEMITYENEMMGVGGR